MSEENSAVQTNSVLNEFVNSGKAITAVAAKEFYRVLKNNPADTFAAGAFKAAIAPIKTKVDDKQKLTDDELKVMIYARVIYTNRNTTMQRYGQHWAEVPAILPILVEDLIKQYPIRMQKNIAEFENESEEYQEKLAWEITGSLENLSQRMENLPQTVKEEVAKKIAIQKDADLFGTKDPSYLNAQL